MFQLGPSLDQDLNGCIAGLIFLSIPGSDRLKEVMGSVVSSRRRGLGRHAVLECGEGLSYCTKRFRGVDGMPYFHEVTDFLNLVPGRLVKPWRFTETLLQRSNLVQKFQADFDRFTEVMVFSNLNLERASQGLHV